MNKPLKDAVREHVEEKRLDEEQLAALEALMERPREEPEQTARSKWGVVLLAAIVLGAIGARALLSATPDDTSKDMAIAREVARNHLKLKPLEVEGSQIEDTATFFAGLDFELVTRSAVLEDKPWSLQGGRHCSIQGEDAAQLRFEATPRGETVSVYMAPYRPALMGEQPDVGAGKAPRRVYVDGLEVLIWVERGVLVATASPGSP